MPDNPLSFPANDISDNILENLKQRVLGKQPYNPVGPVGTPQTTVSEDHIMEALRRGGQHIPIPNDPYGGTRMTFSNQNFPSPIPLGSDAHKFQEALEQQKVAMQEAKATEMAAAAKRSQLMQIINPNHALGAGMLPQGTGGGSIKRPWETNNE